VAQLALVVLEFGSRVLERAGTRAPVGEPLNDTAEMDDLRQRLCMRGIPLLLREAERESPVVVGSLARVCPNGSQQAGAADAFVGTRAFCRPDFRLVQRTTRGSYERAAGRAGRFRIDPAEQDRGPRLEMLNACGGRWRCCSVTK
jgi:hypothetical protein